MDASSCHSDGRLMELSLMYGFKRKSVFGDDRSRRPEECGLQ